MATWDFALALDAAAEQPLFLQIARGIAEAVRSGRLRPGDRLPGTRTLAETLRVHRNTVLAAYQELIAEGWLHTRQGGGTYVHRALPELRVLPAERDPSPLIGFDLGPAPQSYLIAPGPRGTLVFGAGTPDPRLLPVEALSRAYRRVLNRQGSRVLDYADPRGHERLRVALAEMAATWRGLTVTADDVLVTRGSQMGLYLAAQALIRPGDVVAVEGLGYRPAWEALRLAGAELVPVPVDAGGLRIEALETLLTERPVRALYTTPHHQYPTTVSLAPGRRLALLELARRHRMAILEDDYDHEFHYEGRPVLPLASGDRHGVVVYVGTLSKILAPGLRLGFVVAPRPLVEHLTRLRLYIDRQGDQIVEGAVAELLEDREVQRHANKMRRIYQGRRDALLEGLSRFEGTLSFQPPAGGMAVWAHVTPSVDAEAWARRALSLGAAFASGSRFAFAGTPPNALRLGFAQLDEKEIHEGLSRMARALQV